MSVKPAEELQPFDVLEDGRIVVSVTHGVTVNGPDHIPIIDRGWPGVRVVVAPKDEWILSRQLDLTTFEPKGPAPDTETLEFRTMDWVDLWEGE